MWNKQMPGHKNSNKRFAVIGLLGLALTPFSYAADAPELPTAYDVFVFSEQMPRKINASGALATYSFYVENWKKYLIPSSETGYTGGAMSLNDNGVVVGAESGTGDNRFALVWNTRTNSVRRLPSLPAASSTDRIWTQAKAINNEGLIAGETYVYGWGPSGYYVHNIATVWEGNQVRALPLLSTAYSNGSYVGEINSKGQIAGTSRAADGKRHAVIWQGDSVRDLGLPLSSYAYVYVESKALGLNDAGVAVGISYGPPRDIVSGSERATVFYDGRAIALPQLPNSDYNHSNANDINNHGVAVGMSMLGSYQRGYKERAVIWNKLKVRDLNDFIDPQRQPKLELTSAVSINDSGVIMGIAYEGGNMCSFVLVPRR